MSMRQLFRTSLFLSLVALVASTGIDRAEAGQTSRRFKGTAEGVVTEIVTPAQLVIDYVGNATHLGNFTRREEVTFNGDGTFGGTIVFVAANGDELDVDLEGHFVSLNEAVATYVFTGGTGRFADATGTAQATVTTPDFVHVSVSFDGTIDY